MRTTGVGLAILGGLCGLGACTPQLDEGTSEIALEDYSYETIELEGRFSLQTSGLPTGTYFVMRTQSDGRGNLFLWSLANTNPDEAHVEAVQVTTAGVKPIDTPPHPLWYMTVGPTGLGFSSAGRGIESGRGEPLSYLDPEGNSGSIPFVFEGQGDAPIFGGERCESGISQFLSDGTIVGWLQTVPDRTLAAWTWKPGDVARRIMAVGYEGGRLQGYYHDLLPGAPGEWLAATLLPACGSSNCNYAPAFDLVRADGSLLMAEDMLAVPGQFGVLAGWDGEQYVLSGYEREQVNGVAIDRLVASYAWKDGVVTPLPYFALPGITPERELIALAEPMEFGRAMQVLYRDPDGRFHKLPDLKDPRGVLIAGDGVLYAPTPPGDPHGVRRYVPTSRMPTASLQVTSASPTPRVSTDALAATKITGRRTPDDSSLTIDVRFQQSSGGNQRALKIVLTGAAGVLSGLEGKTVSPSGDQGITLIVQYTDILNGSLALMHVKGGALRFERYDGKHLVLALEDVRVGSSAGQTATLRGTITIPEVVEW